jgi:hypothetical protein
VCKRRSHVPSSTPDFQRRRAGLQSQPIYPLQRQVLPVLKDSSKQSAAFVELIPDFRLVFKVSINQSLRCFVYRR